jgi:hypothetical protein
MPRRLLRTVSATLVATFAVLASAAAVCLLPCELTPAVHASEASPAADHCAGAAPAQSGSLALNGLDESCGGQHTWTAPAADRLTSRASVVASAAIIPSGADPEFEAGGHSPLDTATAAPASPPIRNAPLRI